MSIGLLPVRHDRMAVLYIYGWEYIDGFVKIVLVDSSLE